MADSNYRPPQTFKGQIVLWYEGGSRDEDRAAPAVVLVPGHSSQHLRVFGIDNNFDKTCVRHMGDPNAKEYDRINEGGWDFTDNHRPKQAELTADFKNKK